MEQEFSLLKALKIVMDKFKLVVIASIAVAVITAGISLLLPNYYEASTTFYAASPDLSDPTPISTSQRKINVYGNDEDLDRLLSISRSNQLFEYMIDTFALYDHYDIATDDSKAPYKVKKKLLKHMEVLKTKFGAISLTVEDKDPSFASAMANAFRNRISIIAQNLIKDSQQKTIQSYTSNIAEKEKSLQQLVDTLSILREKYGIIDATSQGEVLAQNSADANFSFTEAKATLKAMKDMGMPQDSVNKVIAKVAGLTSKRVTVDKQLKQFNEGISTVKTLENQLVITNDQVSLMKERLRQLESAYLSPFTSLHVVEEAIAPVVKSRPRRSLLVLAAGMLTFILTSLGLLLRDSLKKVDWT